MFTELLKHTVQVMQAYTTVYVQVVNKCGGRGPQLVHRVI